MASYGPWPGLRYSLETRRRLIRLLHELAAAFNDDAVPRCRQCPSVARRRCCRASTTPASCSRWPAHEKNTLQGICLSVRILSHNTAGKSTAIKLPIGELLRMAHVAQHVPHHLEEHLNTIEAAINLAPHLAGLACHDRVKCHTASMPHARSHGPRVVQAGRL